MRRFTVGASLFGAIAMGATLALAALSGPANASANHSSVACHKLTGTISGSFTVSSCTPLNTQYKSATGKSSSLASGTGTATWAPSKKTTKVSLKATPVTPSKCAAGDTEYSVTGKVTGGTATYTHVGDVVSGHACASPTGSLSLLPKTALLL